jgi:hypothetical protein|tara:strand:- start:287 stop:391 length:105 start_codon:yes stop_codon:yes gene_type:complete
MMREGVEPPKRWAGPGEEDNTFSKIEGDQIIYVA